MTQFMLASDGGWSATTANTGNVATLSCLRDGSRPSKDSGQGRELLATMKVEVSHEVTNSQLGSAFLSWNDTSNVLDSTVIPDDTSVIVGRSVSARSGSGSVHVEADVLRGTFGAAKHSALVNAAVLDGVPVSSAIHVVGAWSSGRVETVSTLDLQCTSTDDDVLVASCHHASVTGAQHHGSMKAAVRVVHVEKNVEASIPFAVWAPTLPLSVQLDDNNLQKIRG